jgi:hypothetical protein
MEKSVGKKNVLEIFPEMEDVINVCEVKCEAVGIQLFHDVIQLCAV